MSNPKQPQPGDLSIDASDVTVTDVPKGTVRKLRKLRKGYKQALDILTSLASKSKKLLARAGIDANQVAAAADASSNIDRIGELLPAAIKLVELLKETSQANVHLVATCIEEAAAQTRRRAKDDANPGELLGALEPVLTYQFGPAKKAVATKIKAGKIKPKQAKKT